MATVLTPDPLTDLLQRVTDLETRLTPTTAQSVMDAEQQQLNRLMTSKGAINTITWQVFSIFSASMGGLAAVTTQAPPLIGVVLSFIGCAGGVLWAILQTRMLAHLEMHEDAIKLLEDDLKIDSKRSASTARNTTGLDKVKKSSARVTARSAMKTWICTVTIAWLVVCFVESWRFQELPWP